MNHPTRPTALIIGEALIDIVDNGNETIEHVGGSPANVAVGLARLGVSTTLLTQIGRDARGELIASHLRQAGALIDPTSWKDSPTSTARATLAADGCAHYEFSVRWDAPGPVSASANVVHTGSIALFMQPGGDAVLDLLSQLTLPSIVTVDPNIRPALIGSREQALPRFEDAVRIADVVKLSDEDADWLYPGKSLGEVLQRVCGLGVKAVFVTRGSQGATGAVGGERFDVPAFQVDVVDTIGAGDAFMASLLRAAATEDDFLTLAGAKSAAIEAAAAAALTVAASGANPPGRERLASFITSRSKNN